MQARSEAPLQEFDEIKRKLLKAWHLRQTEGIEGTRRLLHFMSGQKLGDGSLRIGMKPGSDAPRITLVRQAPSYLHSFYWLEMIRELGVAAELMQCKQWGEES